MHKNITLLLFVLLLLPVTSAAFDDEILPASIRQDEGGPVMISGVLNMTNPNIKENTEEPLILLEDQGGFVQRDVEFSFPIESQIIAHITTDFYADEPARYQLQLPISPAGSLNDVDNNGEQDSGVQIYQVSFWGNRFGNIYIDDLDGQGWSSAYSSVRSTLDPARLYEYTGGNILVFAPDDEQGFPAGFGEDQLLFTEDDPIVRLPQGYTAVNMDADPFIFDRSREVTFDLHEPEELAPNDFSDMNYVDAFNALIDVAENEYVFTELKNIDWTALRTEFLPRFQNAQDEGSSDNYLLALRDFSWRIPDSHVAISAPPGNILVQEFAEQTAGGLGISPIEMDDGRILINFVLDGSPASEAGIELGAELLSINGQDIQTAIQQTVAYSAPFSSPHYERLQKIRYMLRFPLNTDVELLYRNPGAEEASTSTLTTIQERDSFLFTSFLRDQKPTDPPVEYRFIDGGYGYIKINSFFGNEKLIVATWEYFLSQVQRSQAPGIIIDLRTNGGGFSAIGLRLAAYMYDREVELYYREAYNAYIDDFFYDERFPATIHPPAPEQRYAGPLAILIGPGCASACEYFSYNFSQRDNVAYVGHYPTGGLAGGVPPLTMPDGINFSLPISRPISLDATEILIEGTGIEPTVRVPINEETAFSSGDPVLESAIEWLSDR